MKARAYRLDDPLRLTALPTDAAVEAVREPEARLWIDLQGAEPGELGRWLEALGLEGLVRRLCLEASHRSGFYPLNDELFLAFPVPDERSEGPGSGHVAFVCRENLLLTLHEQPVACLDREEDLTHAQSWLPTRSIAGLVSAIMVDLSQTGGGEADRLRGEILTLEDRMDRAPDTVEAEQILDVRSSLVQLGATVGDQLPTLQALSVIDKRFFKLDEAREFMHCALVNVEAAMRKLAWLDKRVADLRSAFQMHAQDKANRRLGMLTILSAIFMPITLLAGIWGMNFETMPELGHRFSYPLALLLMALIGTGMYRYFRRTGWFD